MKRLLLFPLVLVLTSCGYASKYEANQACDAWEKKGPTRTSPAKKGPPGFRDSPEYTYYLRTCMDEEKTNQVLGFDKFGQIIKRFHY